MTKREKATRSFWLTNDLLDDLKRVQIESGDERPAHTVRRLIREALKARRLAEQGNTP